MAQLGEKEHTEGAALGGEVGELDLEVDALAIGTAGGGYGALDVALDIDGAEGLLGELGDVGLADGVVLHGDGITEFLREHAKVSQQLRMERIASAENVPPSGPRRRRPRARRPRVTGSAW